MRKRSVIHDTNKLYEHEDKTRIWHLLHEALTETTLVQPIVSSLPSTLVHAAFMRY